MTTQPLDPDPTEPDANPMVEPAPDGPPEERPDLDPIQPGAPH